MSATADAAHPGNRIKAEVIPPGMSVTKAAQLMGVGRPALSNLLNGNSALSPDMAARLERAFNYPLQDLMEMQARYDAAQAKQKDAPADTKSYVRRSWRSRPTTLRGGFHITFRRAIVWRFSCARWSTRPEAD